MPHVPNPPSLIREADPVAGRSDRVVLGVGLMALAVLFFTGIDTSAKWLVLAGLAPMQVAAVRYVGHFVLALAIYLPQEGRSAFRSAAPGWQFLRALSLLTSTLLNFIALTYLPITVTTTIMFAGPVAVTLLSIPLLGETVGRHRIAAVGLGFLGVLVVMQPWGAEFHPAMLLSIGSLIAAALYYILTRKLAGIERNATAQLWTSGIASAITLPLSMPGWVWPESPAVWTVVLLIGAFATIGHIAAVSAHRFADASLLAPVVYIQLVLAALAGILVFGTPPTVWTLAGGLIIVAAGLYIWHRERLLRAGGA